MVVADLNTEEVAGQVELADLAATVVQKLGGSHCSADELVEILGRLVFPVDLRVAGERHWSAHHVEGIDQGVGSRPGK